MNAGKLKGKLKERGITYDEGAKALKISITAFANKVNEKTKFTIMEAQQLGTFLEMTNEEKIDIFLN